MLDAKVVAGDGGDRGRRVWLSRLRELERQLGERTTVLMGTMAAFVFAAQMVNFPVGPVVSGHLLGGALASVLLGPWAGAVVIAAVLLVQCFMFADGGVTALGPISSTWDWSARSGLRDLRTDPPHDRRAEGDLDRRHGRRLVLGAAGLRGVRYRTGGIRARRSVSYGFWPGWLWCTP